MARGGVNDGAGAALAHYARESHPWSPGDGASATTVARFRSAPARLAPDDACAVSVVEDVAAFAGGPVWRIDWCPERPADGGGGAYLAVEAGGGRGAGGCEDGSEIDGAAVRPSSNLHATSFDELGRVSGAGVVQIWRLRAAAAEDGAAGGAAGGKRKRFGQPTRNESNEISSDRGAPANGGGSEARCVLCLAHDGGVAWDLRWSPVRPSDGGGGGTAGGGALDALLGILRKIWALVCSFLGMDLFAARGGGAAPRGDPVSHRPTAVPRGDGADGSNPVRRSGAGGGGNGNVHTLGGLRDDDDEGDDGRNRFWNGNSTQFGGGPADADAGDAPMDGFYTSRNE